jgi:hypothetical protein
MSIAICKIENLCRCCVWVGICILYTAFWALYSLLYMCSIWCPRVNMGEVLGHTPSLWSPFIAVTYLSRQRIWHSVPRSQNITVLILSDICLFRLWYSIFKLSWTWTRYEVYCVKYCVLGRYIPAVLTGNLCDYKQI